jgi:predicted ArsR family transcriptional regulator
VNKRATSRVKADRHRLLGDASRLAIVEALEEGPRQIPELARLLGVHPTTVRSHLQRLLEAGVLEEEDGVPAGRGRPSKRYRLRQPLLGGEPELNLFVGSLVSLLQRAYGAEAAAVAEEEGNRRGREMARTFRHPSFEQAVEEVVENLTRLSFAPAPPVKRRKTVAIDVRHCPFAITANDPTGAVVCAFHRGLVRGMAETSSGTKVDVKLLPFVGPTSCRVELQPQPPAKPDTAEPRAPHRRNGSAT